jgi:hypothetical protein
MAGVRLLQCAGLVRPASSRCLSFTPVNCLKEIRHTQTADKILVEVQSLTFIRRIAPGILCSVRGSGAGSAGSACFEASRIRLQDPLVRGMDPDPSLFS